jgi:hypothetical protein
MGISMAPILKVRRNELDLVKAAAERMARRTNSRVEIDATRVEVSDEDEGTAEPPIKRPETLSLGH